MATLPLTPSGYVLYFAYGSNMSTSQMLQRVGRPHSSHMGCLVDHQLLFNKIAQDGATTYASVVPSHGHAAFGRLYEVDASQLADLDGYEGFPTHYTRDVMPVLRYRDEASVSKIDCPGGAARPPHTVVHAVVYIAHPDMVEEGLCPTEVYLGRLLTAARLLPPWYVQRMVAIAGYEGRARVPSSSESARSSCVTTPVHAAPLSSRGVTLSGEPSLSLGPGEEVRLVFPRKVPRVPSVGSSPDGRTVEFEGEVRSTDALSRASSRDSLSEVVL